MAAGMGSRFGGLKQIEPMGPNGEFLIDYSIYDALKCGFTKVVFVIKRENEQIFKETIGRRIEKKIKVEYAYQDLNSLPDGYTCPSDRVKPWGTAHAILAAKDLIHEPFVIINSDDFYGLDAYRIASRYLDNKKDYDYFVVGYKVGHTLSNNGSVKRGVCVEQDGKLEKLIESKIEVGDEILASPLDGSKPFYITSDTLVSMNMLGFDPTVFTYLEDHFKEFLDSHKEDIKTCEYLIPESIKNMIKEGYAKVELLKTDAKWLGVTYMEDKDDVVKAIQALIDNKVYPEKLWE